MSDVFSSVRRSARAPSPTTRELAAVVFRQRRVVLIGFCGILLIVVLYGLFAPAYQAQMTFLVRRGRLDPAITATPTQTLQVPFSEVSEQELNSEVELLRNEGILRKVVKDAGLVRSVRQSLWGEDNEATRLARAVQTLARRLEIEPLHKTALIGVRYSCADPAEGERVLQALSAAYLERHRQVHRVGGGAEFFERQISESARVLQNAEREFGDFMVTRGVVSAGLERDLTLQKLSDTSASILQAEIAQAEAAERIRKLQAKLEVLPERRTAQVRSADNAQLIEKMRSKLLELELKRTELLTKFQPTYRLVQEVEEQIAETKLALAAERAAPVRDETTEPDPNYEWAAAELVKSEVERDALEARAAAGRRVAVSLAQRAHRLGENAIMQEQLQRTLRTAEDRYLLYVGKREESRMGDALDERGILNVTLAEPPVAPALPSRSRWRLAMIGVLLAGGVSMGLGFVADYLDPSLRTPPEVVDCLGTRVLASLPKHMRLPA